MKKYWGSCDFRTKLLILLLPSVLPLLVLIPLIIYCADIPFFVSLAILCVIAFMVCVYLFYISIIISDRFRELIKGVQDMVNSGYKEKIPVVFDDDVSILTKKINEMANLIEITIDSNNKLSLKANDFEKSMEKATVFKDELVAKVIECEKADEEIKRANQDLRMTLRNSESLRKDLIKARKSAEDAAKAKSDFLANMSHEIRTPMNAILGFSSLLQKTTLTHGQRNYLNSITSSGEMLISIINDILDFSKMEAGKIQFEEIDFNLEYLLSDVFKIVIERMKDAPFDTYIDVEEEVPHNLKGDPTRLRQIFVNLLNNAIKFTHSGSVGIKVRVQDYEQYYEEHVKKIEEQSTISLTLYEEKVEKLHLDDNEVLVVFSVKDTGIGIEEEQLENIFKSFTQADESTTRKYGGTGLGLAITRSIIEEMGGKIWVESQKDVGTEFKFAIVFKKSEPTVKQDIYPLRNKALKGLKVLIVDDNPIARKINAKCCESLGMTVVSAEDSAPSAIDRLYKLKEATNLPDFMLCDIMMSGMSGLEMIKAIKDDGDFKSVKAIALTADPEIGSANKAQEQGFDGYLPKPVVVEELVKVVATVFGDNRYEKTIVTKHMAEELSCKGVKILVVEDSIPNQLLMKAYFSELGCDGDYVSNGQEAIDILREGAKYDLVFMDLQMPVMGGVEATKIIRKEISADLPIIALTAAVLSADRKKTEESGMNDFVAKPVDMMTLKEKIVLYKNS